jgi:uncharacterized protein (TIGR04255 family)
MATLPANEIFPNPTVKQVVFQIRYPNLFFLESRIGDLQLSIMSRFPTSELSLQKAVVFAQGTDQAAIQKALVESEHEGTTRKIWLFKSTDDVTVEVKQDSLTLTTTSHKSYRSGPTPFREVINFILDAFFKTTGIPIVLRIGMRYIDECPLPELSTAKLREYYNTALPVDRFPIDGASEMAFRTQVPRGLRKLRYMETIVTSSTGQHVVLDFDASSENVPSATVLAVADELHQIIRSEFEATIKEPVLAHMRTPRS